MFLTQFHKRVTCEDIEYSINEEEKTASITRCQKNATEIHIPRSIKHESNEYIITSISRKVFSRSKIRSVAFEPNSELRIIEKGAFERTFLSNIIIPARVTRICENAFEHCRFVQVVFEPNSELQVIEKGAFERTFLSNIIIPAHVTRICENALSDCRQLVRIEFESNSELRTIEKKAFSNSKLSCIKIPASTVELEDGWCIETDYLNHVEVEQGNARYLSIGGKFIIGKSDITNENYDTLIFWTRDSVEVKIPEMIKIIGSYSFSHSIFANILIPAHVTQICKGAFSNCSQPVRIEFESNSELRTIEKEAFSNSKLSCIKIPASTVELEDGWCIGAENLNHVEVEQGNARYLSIGGKFIIGKSDIMNENYDTLIFWTRDSVEVKIPEMIKII